MRQIYLTRGKVALVDDEDYSRLTQFSWSAAKMGRTWYAVTNVDGRTIGMHRVVRSGERVDHWDGNGLNNVRENLRPCTKAQNSANSRKRDQTSSRFKGVTWSRKSGKWQAQLKSAGRTHYLGMFTREDEAARAYDSAAAQHFGQFARLNFCEKNPSLSALFVHEESSLPTFDGLHSPGAGPASTGLMPSHGICRREQSRRD